MFEVAWTAISSFSAKLMNADNGLTAELIIQIIQSGFFIGVAAFLFSRIEKKIRHQY